MSAAESRAFEVAEVDLSRHRACALSRNGEVACWGELPLAWADGVSAIGPQRATGIPHRLEGISGARQIALTEESTLYVLRDNGTVTQVRDDYRTQQPGMRNIVALGASTTEVCALEAGGDVRCRSGYQNWRTHAPRDGRTNATGLACGRDVCCAWDEHRPPMCRGGNGAAAKGAPESGIRAMEIGRRTICAETAESNPCWGWSLKETHGKAWTPPDTARKFPTPSPCWLDDGKLTCISEEPWVLDGIIDVEGHDNYACAIDRQGGLWCWGSNDKGQLADGHRVTSAEPRLARERSPQDETAGSPLGWHDDQRERLVVTDDGGLKFRDHDLVWHTVSSPERVASLARTAAGSVLLGRSGRVYRWAFDGSKTDIPRFDITPVGISNASEIVGHAYGGCARTVTGAVQCWGLDRLFDPYIPVLGPQESEPTVIPGLEAATSLAAGWRHVCGIAGGEVRCFGGNRYGQLGPQAIADTSLNVHTVPLPGAAVELSTGTASTCATLQDGRTFCWGSDLHGELRQGRRPLASHPMRTVLGPLAPQG